MSETGEIPIITRLKSCLKPVLGGKSKPPAQPSTFIKPPSLETKVPEKPLLTKEQELRQELEGAAKQLLEQCGYSEDLFKRKTPLFPEKEENETQKAKLLADQATIAKIILGLVGKEEKHLPDVRPDLTINEIIAQVYSYYPRLAQEFIQEQALARVIEEKLHPDKKAEAKTREDFLPYQGRKLFFMDRVGNGEIARQYLALLQTTRGFKRSQMEQGKKPTLILAKTEAQGKEKQTLDMLFAPQNRTLIDNIVQTWYFPQESFRKEYDYEENSRVIASSVTQVAGVTEQEIRELRGYCSGKLAEKVNHYLKSLQAKTSQEKSDPRKPTTKLQEAIQTAAASLTTERKELLEKLAKQAKEGDRTAMGKLEKVLVQSKDPEDVRILQETGAAFEESRKAQEKAITDRNASRARVRDLQQEVMSSSNPDRIREIKQEISRIYNEGTLSGLPESQAHRDYYLEQINEHLHQLGIKDNG